MEGFNISVGEQLPPVSADDSKYEKRAHASSKWGVQRIVAAFVVAVTLVLLLGDGLILGNKVTQRGKPRITARDVHVLVKRAGGPTADADAAAAAAAPVVRKPAAGGKRAKPAQAPAAAASASKAGTALEGSKLLEDAWANDEWAWEDKAALKPPAPAAAAWAVGGAPNTDASYAQALAGLPWSTTDAATCDGFFGNGYSEYTLLAHQDGVAKGEAVAAAAAGGGGDVESAVALRRAQRGTGKSAAQRAAAGSSSSSRSIEAELTGKGIGDGTVGQAPSALAWCRSHPVLESTVCGFRNVAMNPARLQMARGGEKLEEVMGRQEDVELPRIESRAFQILGRGITYAAGGESPGTTASPLAAPVFLSQRLKGTQALQRLQTHDKFKLAMVDGTEILPNARGVPAPAGGSSGGGAPADDATDVPCDLIVPDDGFPVIFVTRVEYANLFHTSTDWYNVWQTARLAGLTPTDDYTEAQLRGLTPEMAAIQAASPRTVTPRIPAHVVFIDGHNASPMDDGWLGMFLSINYAKHFKGRACFSRAYYSSFGYRAAISVGFGARTNDCRANKYVQQFGVDMVRAYGLVPRPAAACAVGSGDKIPVLFVRRVHYKAHPRHNGQIVRRLDNEDDIYSALEAEAKRPGSKISLMNGLFSSMTVGEQIRMVQDSCLVVGAHGAGLSHILFGAPDTHMLELRPPAFMRPHFIAYSYWAGAIHHDWTLGTSTPPVSEVVSRILSTASDAAAAATRK